MEAACACPENPPSRNTNISARGQPRKERSAKEKRRRKEIDITVSSGEKTTNGNSRQSLLPAIKLSRPEKNATSTPPAVHRNRSQSHTSPLVRQQPEDGERALAPYVNLAVRDCRNGEFHS